MLHTTFELLRHCDACKKGYRKLAKRLGGVTKYGKATPIPLTAVLESNGIDDALWCLQATLEPADGFSRDFVRNCAFNLDQRTLVAAVWGAEHSAVDTVRAVRSAVWSTVWNTARDEADAAQADMRNAVWNAAWDTAWSRMAEGFRVRLLAHDPNTNPLGGVPEPMPLLPGIAET